MGKEVDKMGLFRKGETVNALLVDKGGKEIIQRKLRREDGTLNDSLVCKSYEIVTPPIFFKKGRKKQLVYLVDEEKGVTVEITKNNGLLELNTNPTLIGKASDSRILTQAFSIKPETRVIWVAMFIGTIIGFFLGGIFL
jgi:hypothetical protein